MHSTLFTLCTYIYVQWNPSNQDTLKWGNLDKQDTFCCPKYHACVQFNPWTSLIRTLSSVPRVSGLERFHCTYCWTSFMSCRYVEETRGPPTTSCIPAMLEMLWPQAVWSDPTHRREARRELGIPWDQSSVLLHPEGEYRACSTGTRFGVPDTRKDPNNEHGPRLGMPEVFLVIGEQSEPT